MSKNACLCETNMAECVKIDNSIANSSKLKKILNYVMNKIHETNILVTLYEISN
jgi:hypothetical protein